jgi:hypothetical protein
MRLFQYSAVSPRYVSVVALSLVLLGAWAWAAKEFVKPAAKPAASYPAHDTHTDEGVTIAADPYDMPDKASIFTINYQEQGLLPIFVVVTNDTDQPLALSGMKAQLQTADRTKITPSDADDIYRRLSRPNRSNNPYPLPLPRSNKVKGAVSRKTLDEIQNAAFNAKAVEPHTTQAGFFFFDVAGISAPVAGARLYVTGVRNAKGDDLMYFEIALEKYLSAPDKPQGSASSKD